MGPCGFTEGGFNNFMLENELTGGEHETIDVLDPEERRKLAQVFLDAVCYQYSMLRMALT